MILSSTAATASLNGEQRIFDGRGRWSIQDQALLESLRGLDGLALSNRCLVSVRTVMKLLR